MKNKPFANNRIDYLVSLAEPSKSSRILNVGISNIPEVEMVLENKVKECVTIDIDRKKLENASKYLKKTKLVVTDITKETKLKKNNFDAIIISEVLEHIDDDNLVVSKLRELLKKKGKIIVAVPNKSLFHIINPVKYVEHKRHYSNSDIIKLLESNGFKIDHFNVVESFTRLVNLYIHLFFKFILRKTIPFNTFSKRSNKTYNQINKSGLDIIVRAVKI